MRSLVLLTLVAAPLVIGCGPSPAAPDAAFSADERGAVDALLARRRGWRLATLADHGDTAGVRELRAREAGYHPYVRRGDWNRDGHRDLAIVLVRGDRYEAWWIPGSARGPGAAHALGETTTLRAGGLFEFGGELAIGPFESDAIDLYRWDARTATLELVPDPLGEGADDVTGPTDTAARAPAGR